MPDMGKPLFPSYQPGKSADPLSELLEPPYIEYRDTDIPYKFKKNKEYEGISFCVYAKKMQTTRFTTHCLLTELI